MNLYYVAFVVDRDLAGVDAGVDLLDGPFATYLEAMQALPSVVDRFPRHAAYTTAAARLAPDTVMLDVVRVNKDMVSIYNTRHETYVPWPPPCVKGEEW